MERDGDAAVEAACRARPELAEPLRRGLANLRGVGFLGAAAATSGPPRQLGEFRLLQRLGQGGMGVVYKARQDRLDRDVAIKIVRPEHLFFAGARERFLREIAVIARLQHPNIVPIHAVGEDAGVPWFVMDLVVGRDLGKVLQQVAGRDRSELTGTDLAPDPQRAGYLYAGSWEEACLRVARQIAEALAHAHQRGVVHRDVKPANIMLTADGSERALLFDFGLAAVAGAGRLTRSGAQLGSLQYMAPEQVRGELDRIGPHTDVYGLGVTLYEMLTLTPAFAAQSDPELILLVQQGEARSVRDVNPTISWEAATVCATAMDVDPARRYRSAADFARDLLNVLERRPIEARRAGMVLRARRFVERRPGLAAVLAMGGILVIGGPSAWAWQQHRAATAIAAQRDRAERNYGRAIAAVDRLLTRVGAVDLRLVPQMEPVRRAVLEDAVVVLQEFVAEEEHEATARQEVAEAHQRLGTLLANLGRNQEAVAAQSRGIETLLGGDGTGPTAAADRLLLARLRVDLARGLSGSGRAAEARAEHARAAALLASLREESPHAPEIEELTAGNERTLGLLLRSLGEGEEAQQVLATAAARAERAWQETGDRTLLVEASRCTEELALLMLQRLQPATREATQETLERAIALTQQLVALDPEDPTFCYALALARGNYAGLWRRLTDYDRARTECRQALEDMARLVRRFPDTLLYQLELATLHNQIGLCFDYEQRNEEAEPEYRRTVELLRELARRAPNEPIYSRRLGVALMNHSVTAKNRGDLQAAAAELEDGVVSMRRALELAPLDAEARHEAVQVMSALAFVRRLAGDHERAVQSSEEIATIAQRWAHLRIAAYGYADASLLAARDERLEPAARERTVTAYQDRAIELLRQALERAEAAERPSAKELREGRSFAALRGLAAFEALCDGLR